MFFPILVAPSRPTEPNLYAQLRAIADRQFTEPSELEAAMRHVRNTGAGWKCGFLPNNP